MRVLHEGGGFVLECACSWLRFAPSRSDVETMRAEHERKCNGEPKRRREKAQDKRAAASWETREGSTWIDKL